MYKKARIMKMMVQCCPFNKPFQCHHPACPPNLVPRVSLLCLPWSLEERPWLMLVTLPPRIWVAKKSVGWEEWQSVLFG